MGTRGNNTSTHNGYNIVAIIIWMNTLNRLNFGNNALKGQSDAGNYNKRNYRVGEIQNKQGLHMESLDRTGQTINRTKAGF